MELAFCPSEVSWGNVATWAAAVAAMLSACAVFYLGLQANALAKAQESVATTQRKSEAFVVMRLIGPDAFAMLPLIEVVKEFVTDKFTEDQFLNDPRLRNGIREMFNEISFPMMEKLLDRLQVLEPACAEAAAHAVATLKVIQLLCSSTIGNPQLPDGKAAFDKRNRASLQLLRTEVKILYFSVKLLHDARPLSQTRSV